MMAPGMVMRNQDRKEGTYPRGERLPQLSIQSINGKAQSKDLSSGECMPKRIQPSDAGANWALEIIESIPFH